MNSFERRNKIVDLVNSQGSVLVLDLSNTFGISEVTIRADLRLLEDKGLVTRFHGGAARPGTNLIENDNQEVVLEERYQLASDPKKRIAPKKPIVARSPNGSTWLPGTTTATRMVNGIKIRLAETTEVWPSSSAGSRPIRNS
jgi:DeoR family transcriptional regulator, galactitol utilization operon repressor